MKRNGFTLIELLVVVAIIGVLATIALLIFSDVQKGVRDLRRKQDLRTIQTALEIYYQKNGRYPCTLFQPQSWEVSSSDYWIKDDLRAGGNCGGKDLDSNYIDITPKDPKNSTGFPWDQNKFSYSYWAGDTTSSGAGQFAPLCNLAAGQYYILIAKLEKDSDPSITRFKPYFYCDNQTEIIGTEIIPYNAYDLDMLYIMTSQD